MKILHVTPAYVPAYRYGGPIQTVHALNKYLVRAGAEVKVYTTAADGFRDLAVPFGIPVEVDGVQVHYFKPSWPRSWFYSSDMARALKDRMREFDIVHITSVFLSPSTLAASAALAAARPYLISPRGALMQAPLRRKSRIKKSLYTNLVERRNLHHAAAIHFTTEMEKKEYESAGLPLGRAVIIPNGVDPGAMPPGDPQAFRRRLGIAPGRRIVLFLGRLSWKKGFDVLIPAFARIADSMPEAVLVIAGGDDEGYGSKINKLIARYGVGHKTILAGRLEGADRSAAYQSADIFVLPSHSENFAATVAEAMYFGAPVIISENVGLAPEIRRAGAGLVVGAEPKALATEISRLLRSDILAGEMRGKGKAFIAKFSYDRVASQFLEAYQDIISGR